MPRLKLASSAAHVAGRTLASAEAFTWLGEHFQVSLASEGGRRLAVLSGVNHLVYHGVPYSPAGLPWPGWQFYASVNFAPEAASGATYPSSTATWRASRRCCRPASRRGRAPLLLAARRVARERADLSSRPRPSRVRGDRPPLWREVSLGTPSRSAVSPRPASRRRGCAWAPVATGRCGPARPAHDAGTVQRLVPSPARALPSCCSEGRPRTSRVGRPGGPARRAPRRRYDRRGLDPGPAPRGSPLGRGAPRRGRRRACSPRPGSDGNRWPTPGCGSCAAPTLAARTTSWSTAAGRAWTVG